MLLQSEHPLKLGWEGQHQHSLRTSWTPNSYYMDSDKYANGHVKVSHIPCIKWKTPSKFDLNANWYVVSGEESKEREIQKHRETRVPEAIYLCTAAIPQSPSVSVDVEHWHYDDISIPLIPLKPIEEETPPNLPSEKEGPSRSCIKLEALKLAQHMAPIANEKPAMDQPASSDSSAIQIPDFLRKPGLYMDPHASSGCAPTKGKPDVGTRPYLKGDAVAAASAAFTAMIKSKELGNLIDTELLIQLLNHPERIVKSVTEQGVSLDAPTSAASKMAKEISSAPLTGTNVSMVIKRPRDEFGASANSGSYSLPDTDIDTKKRKFMYEPTAPPLIRTTPISGVKKEIPTLPLPLPGTNMEIKRGNNELGVPATFAPILSSRPKSVTKQSNNQQPSSSPITGTGTGTGVASDSRAPSMAISGSLSDGKMVKNRIDGLREIVHKHGCVEQVQQSGSPFASLPTSSAPDLKKYRTESMLVSLPRPNTSLPDLQTGPLSSELPDKPSSSFATGPQVKDSAYYKSLIIQYGDEGKNEDKFQNTQHNPGCLQQLNNMNLCESKSRKPCFFFNSAKGCRNGATCAFQHIVWNDSSPSLSPGLGEECKSLIMQHAGEGNNDGKFQNNSSRNPGCLQVNNNMNPFELKFRKLCLYFNSAKGCRNGATCPFQHIVCDGLSPSPSRGASETPSAKRVKQSGIIREFGRT